MDKRKDLAFALAVAMLGGAIAVLSFDITLGRVRDPIGARALPLVTGIFILVVGLGLAARRLLRWRQDPVQVDAEGAPQDQSGVPGSTMRAMLTWLLCLGYVLILPRAGFIVLTPLLIAAMMAVMGIREARRIVTLSLVTTGAMYWILGVLLNVRLPLGPLRTFLS